MNKKLTNKKVIFYMILMIFVITSMISIGFSALDSSLSVTGDLVYRKDENIRITGLKVSDQKDNASNIYTPKYTTNKLIVGINLPNIDSEITYEIDITNYSSSNMCLESINNLIYSNELIEYEIVNLDYNQKIPGGGYLLKAKITFRYKDKSILPTNTKLDATIQFNFKEYISGSLITSYSCANVNSGLAPYNFTYTGNCEVIDDGDNNWRVKFLTSGNLSFNNLANASDGIDVFLVGGGGAGGKGKTGYINNSDHGSGGGGGGSGYTATYKNINIDTQTYEIVIGDGGTSPSQNGNDTTGFGFTVKGGKGGVSTSDYGTPGAGGIGGSNGGFGAQYKVKGTAPGSDGNPGQGTTTREFGESTGILYAGGGGGGVGRNWNSGSSPVVPGGDGGGGKSGEAGVQNTGGGGGGGNYNGSQKPANGGSGIVIIRNSRTTIADNKNTIPKFTYTGKYEIVDDNDNIIGVSEGNWKIRFLTSGTLTITDLRSAANGVDIFLVGGGGAGGNGDTGYINDSDHGSGGGGGGSGYTATYKNININTQTYEIVIGDGGTSPSKNGNDTTGFGFTVKGGKGGVSTSNYNTSGAGGIGGSNGGFGAQYKVNGTAPGSDGNPGQGTTTREFGEATGRLYAGGGGGGVGHDWYSGSSPVVPGGAGGGGKSGEAGAENTGSGGGGGNYNGSMKPANGGSGIVIIRNSRTTIPDNKNTIPKFTYTGKYEVVDDDDNIIGVSEGNWKIRFLTSGTLTITDLRSAANGIDIFLVGGGGAGGNGKTGYINDSDHGSGGGGGGSGYTATYKNININTQTYEIVIGDGGISPSRNGMDTTGFGFTAKGGKGGVSTSNYNTPGAGGDGGSNGGYGAQHNVKGTAPGSDGNPGQGTTTREFGEATGRLYAGGGGGGVGRNWNSGSSPVATGGAGGGGKSGEVGAENTGSGGGGGNYNGSMKPANGGSGIIIIRNVR